MVGVLVAALLLLPGAAAAECDPRCERQTASQLLKRGETRAAGDLEIAEIVSAVREEAAPMRGELCRSE